jgi:DNA-binding CsgD family transcriptional regulator
VRKEKSMGKPRLPNGAPSLRGRHLDVLGAAAEGLTHKETAVKLHISPETVKVYRKEAILICNARNTTHAVALSIRAGLL